MAGLRQMFDGISSLKAGVAAVAIATLSGCAIQGGNSHGHASGTILSGLPGFRTGPQIIAGTANEYRGPGAAQFQQGWETMPNTYVKLDPNLNDPYSPPRLQRMPVVITREASPEDVAMVKACNRVPDKNRYMECVLPSTPAQVLLELSNQLIYAKVNCGRPSTVETRRPGTNDLDTYLRVQCGTTGDYAVKLQQNGPIIPVIYGGRPAY